jgi:nitrate reductase NapA
MPGRYWPTKAAAEIVPATTAGTLSVNRQPQPDFSTEINASPCAMSGVDRRSFVKELAAASVAAAATWMVPAHGPLASGAAGARAPLDWQRAPCRLCGVGCGLLIGSDNGRPAAVRADPDSPVGRGLACVRGYLSVQALRGADRLSRALIRRDGVLVPVPLDQALDLVAGRIRDATQRHGKDSVAVYGSAQWSMIDAYVATKLVKGGLGTNNLDTSTRLHAASAMKGLETTFGLDGSVGCYEDVDHADTFVLWDCNLAETSPVLFSRILARRRDNPAVRIIEVATRTTRTSYAADQSALFAPHGALEIAHAICHELAASHLADWAFVDRYVTFRRSPDDLPRTSSSADPSPGLPMEIDRQAYLRFLDEFTAERVQHRVGMPAATIRWLASLYGDRTRRVMSIWDANVHQDIGGTATNNALHNIHLLVGKVASPGNGGFPLPGQPNGGCMIHEAGSLAGTLPRGVVTEPADRQRAASIWGVPESRIDTRPGLDAIGMFDALDRGEIRVLWIQAANPMLSLPNLERYRRAARRPDHFIVVSEAYPTPTTDIADVVLPVALWIEREGIYANVERRIQHFNQLAKPRGDATSDAELMIAIGRRLGFGPLFQWEPARLVEQIWEEYRRFHEDGPTPLPEFAALRDRPGVIWPSRIGGETRWRYATALDAHADKAHGEFDFYGHADHRAWIWLRPATPAVEPPDRQFPLWLTTGGVLEHWGGGSMTQRIPTLHSALPHAYVEINADDAAALGVQRGEVVRLVSRRGALELEARVDYRSQPPKGEVFVPTFDEGRPINLLMGGARCPLSGQPDDRKCAVRIERLRGAGG